MSNPAPPVTAKAEIVETLHGVRVPDPYRWLEDPDSAETTNWVAQQRVYCEQVLGTMPERAWFAAAMGRIVARPRAGVPWQKGGWYFGTRNDGTLAQDLLIVGSSLAELVAGGRVLLDPNGWSPDGTVALGALTVSDDGELAAYARSVAGSDWLSIGVVRVATGVDVPVTDSPNGSMVTKFASPEWLPDGRSFTYLAWPDRELGDDGTQTAALGGSRLMVHRLGEPVASDVCVVEFPDHPRRTFWVDVSADGQWLAVSIAEGTQNRNRLWLYPISTRDGRSVLAEPLKVIDHEDAEASFVRTDGHRLILLTDADAPRGRVVGIDLGQFALHGIAEPVELIPEGADTIVGVRAAGEILLVERLSDAAPRVSRYSLHGEDLGDLPIWGGAIAGIGAGAGVDDVFIGVSTVTSPTTVTHLAASTGETRTLRLVQDDGLGSAAVRTSRRRARSADLTAVPYFLIEPDAAADGPRPTLLYGYGGFKVPVAADYRPGWPAWLAAGGVLAIANLRGGGEFGTDWYDDGRLARKQNVFADCIAVAEDLIASGVTTAGQLALHGRSNGGLLVGAVLTQRPDLFAAAIPTVGVLDILRFHKFTIGSAWISDYGDPQNQADFEVALRYSPLHNVRAGVEYPPTLVTTADHDDRVVPLHSFKFTAAMQAVSPSPAVARIELSAGHGAGKPAAALGAEWADILTFAAHFTGLRPPSAPGADR